MSETLPIQGDSQPNAVVPVSERIFELERELLKHEQVPIIPVHYFADNLYAREITIPKGVTLTGRVHLTNHINIVLSGDITVMTDDGMKRIKGPAIFTSKAGTKRAGYAHEETVWVTFIGTNEKDADLIEDTMTTNSVDEYRALVAGEVPRLGE